MRCCHNSCTQQVYGGNTLCYYHRKVEKGQIKTEDRPIYLHSESEITFAKLTDSTEVNMKSVHKQMESPQAVEIIKLALYMLAKQTDQQVSYFKGDVYIALMIHLAYNLSGLSETKRRAAQIASDVMQRYKKETEYQNHEVCFIDVRDVNHLNISNPESEVEREQEEHAKLMAFHTAKKSMTKIERKVFSMLENGCDETTIANRLHLSKQRVNKLKQRSCKRVKEIIDGMPEY